MGFRTTYIAIQNARERTEACLAQLQTVILRSRSIIQETQALLRLTDQRLSAPYKSATGGIDEHDRQSLAFLRSVKGVNERQT